MSDKLFKNINDIGDVDIKISFVLGSKQISISKLLDLYKGVIINLDQKANGQIDIYANEKLIAKGELVTEKDKIGVSITNIV